MDIIFKSNKFRKIVHDERQLNRTYGKINAKKIRQRIDDLFAAETLEDVRNLPGRYHELKAERKGQIACDLEHPYRLIFKPVANPMPIDKNGQMLWSEITIIEIIEIVDYH